VAKRVWIFVLLMLAFIAAGRMTSAQTVPESSPPTATMKQLMLDYLYPASNDLFLLIARGGPKDEKDWGVVRRSAITLAESGNLLMRPGRARDQGAWLKDTQALADVGRAAYQAAQNKDLSALGKLMGSLDSACTNCHKQYRPNVFPREGGSK
jgi:hypothetical protein